MRVPCARIGALGIVMTLGLLLTACAGRVDPAELDAVEVREYEGKDLSAINDFRENSIKGTQRIDQEAYRLEVTGLVDEPLSLAYDEVLDR
jgi:DMSO/TMAO reductase YedYZ molybdopterin-dependent catalytic subunit